MSDNPFLELADQVPSQGGSPSLVTGAPVSQPAANDNPFLDLADKIPSPNLQPAAIQARQHQPDAYVKAETLGKQVGLPADVLARNPNEAKRIEMESMLAGVQQRNPALASWLADGANLTVAQDDVPQLTGLAGAIQTANDYMGAPARGLYNALGWGVSGIGDLLDSGAYGAARLAGNSPQEAEAYMRESKGSYANPSTWLHALGDFIGSGAVYGLATKAGTELSGHPELNPMTPLPAERSNLAIQSLEGLGNFGGQAIVTLANPAAGIAMLLGQGAQQQAQMAHDAGKEGTGEAYAAIVASAPIAAALEKIPLHYVLNMAPPGVKNAVARYILDKIAAAGLEATSEGAEQVTYNALARLYNPDQSLTDQVGSNFTVGGIVGGLARILLGHRFARTRAETESQNLSAMEQAASQSVLRTRDPARFSALIKQLVGQGNDTVYLNAEAAQTYFQSANIDPANIGINPRELADQVALGGDIAVPMETWLTSVAPDHAEGLRDYRRMGQASMSPDEAKSHQEIDDAAERFLSSLQDAQAEPDTRVFNDVVGQLLGKMSQAEAEKSALPVQGLFNYLAKATGQDGLALYQKYGLQILQARPDLAAMLPRSNIDANLDSMLDRVASGDIPTAKQAFGPSLADFLAEKGGINDQAMTGELKRIAESDRVTRKGMPRLVRPDAKLSLDYAREAAVEAGYLPENSSVNDLIDALDNEVGHDKPVFSIQNENRQASDIRSALTELSDELGRLGMDPTQDREAIKRALLGDQTGDFFQSSDAAGAAGKNLIATHNISVEKLRHALRVGGLAVPSLSITKGEDAQTNFGEITLIGSRSMIDPKLGAKAFGADVYSPRYPELSYKLSSTALNKLNEKLAPYHEGKGRPIYGSDISRLDDLLQLDSFKAYAKKMLGGKDGYHEQRDLAGALLSEIGADEKIFMGFTANGRRYKPHTLENVVAILKKGIRGGEGFNYGVGSLRAKFTPQFRSVEAIKKNADKLVSKEQFEKIKKEIDDEFFAIVDSMRGDNQDGNSFGFADRVIGVMEDAVRLGIPRSLREYEVKASPEAQEEMAAFLNKLRTLPTEYFEVKQPRAVSLQEFTAAIVPDGTPDDVRAALTKRGLDIQTYARGDDAARKAAIHEAAKQNNLLFQSDTDTRGFLRIGDNRQMTIGLTPNANLSTFLHETGHFMLEVMGDMAEAGSSEQVSADYAAVLKWFGVANRAEITTEHHEQFARGFEQYLGEGKAPTPELAGAFARFRAWMKAIYKTLTALNVELSDDVRGVFDRIVAGDPELVRARATVDAGPLFKEAARSGMSEARFKEYLRLSAEANDEDEARITAEAMREVEREHKAWWKAEWGGIAAEVTAEFHALPVYQAWAALNKNQQPDGTPLETPAIKLDKAALLDRYGQDFLTKNLSKKHVYADEGGVNPDMAANLFGFRSGDELVTALANAAPLKKAITAEADARMRERHGDMRMDGSLPNKAMQAVHNDKRFKALTADIALLEKLSGEPAMPAAAVRQWAMTKIGGTKISQLTPFAYLRSERKHAREAARLTAAGKWKEALLAQRRRLAFAHLYDVAVKAQERVETRTKWMARQNRKATQKRLAEAGGEFRDQFNAVLAAVGLRQPEPAGERGTLRAFVESRQEALDETAVSDAVLALVDGGQAVNLDDMTVGQFNEVYAAARNIAHLAGQRNRMLASADKAKFNDVVEAITARVAETHPERLPEELSRRDLSAVERARDRARKLAAELDRPENIVEALDGGESGPFHDYFWNALNNAEGTAAGLRRRIGSRLRDLRLSMPSDFMASLDEKVDVPRIGRVSRGTLVGMVLNTGNAGNFQRLRDGGVQVNGAPVRLSDAEVANLRELLTNDELRYVQGLWDTVNSLWPDITALQKAMSGIVPPKVEAAAFTVRGQTYQGGYWPLAYDHSKSQVGEKQSDDDALRVMAGAGYSRATTPQGHQKARVEEVSAPLQLDFGAVMSRHLDNVMTDIAYRAAVKDTMRLLRSTRIKDAIISRLGKGAYDTLKGSVAYAVSPSELSVQAATSARRVMAGVVSNTAVSALAIRPDIALGNYGSAMVQALDRVGARSLMRGWWAMHTPGQAELTDRIRALSPFMAERLGDIDHHYAQEVGKVQGKRGYGAAYKRLMMTLHRWADHDVTRAAWWGRYQEAMDGGADSAEAVRLADKMVRQTQTATARKDVAAIERDPAFRESRIFMGPMFVILGRLRAASKGEGATRTVGLRAASLLRQVFIAPALFVLLAGHWPEDDDKDGEISPGEWSTWLAVNTLLFPLQTIPILREASAAVTSWATGRPISPRAAPTAQAVAGMVKASQAIVHDLADYEDTGELDWYEMTRDLVSAVGPLFGAPSAQVQKTTKALEYLQDNPDTGAVELARLAVYGPPKK